MAETKTRDIPFFNYKGAFAADEEQFVDIFRDVLRRGAFIQQRDLADFESNLATYLGVKHVFGVANATDALIMAWKAIGLKPGQEVIFPSHTMAASPASVAHSGGIPVPVDIGDDHLINPAAIESAITPRTVAILPVQLNGRTADMGAIQQIADKHNLYIVEDSAQALGSRFDGRFAGTFGLVGVFSFYPAKILGCFGDGGALITNDDRIAERIALLRDHGRDSNGDVVAWGFNSRLDNLQAAILDYQFKEYASIISHRRALAASYDAALHDIPELLLPPPPDADPIHFDVYQNYEIEAERRDLLREHLKEAGIGTIIQWGGKAIHQFERLGFKVSLPRTDTLFRRALMLPMNMMVSMDDAEHICEVVRRFYGR
ncbi:MAG: cell wall biosis protein [Gemmatimonadales bacterium]|nr:cell wall biosis protein [Gemmatimonadales bacterium]